MTETLTPPADAGSDRARIARRIALRRRPAPRITHDAAGRFQPFPLTDMQYAYWAGRQDGLQDGGAMQMLVEFVTDRLDTARLERAWNALIRRHDMLRAVVDAEGRQRVIEPAPRQPLIVDDVTALSPAAREAEIEALRRRLHAEVKPLDRWPQSELRFVRTDPARPEAGRLFMRFDMWCFDGRSFQVVVGELATLYRDPEAVLQPLEICFRDYVAALACSERTPAFARALAWWRDRLATLPPPPALPQARPAEAGDGDGGAGQGDAGQGEAGQGEAGQRQTPGGAPSSHRFRRHVDRLDVLATARLKRMARDRGLGLPAVMATAYAEVLARWSDSRHFTLNVPRFNRPDWHGDIPRMVGEFASFSLLEIDLRRGQDFLSRAQAVQQRLWSDLEHQAVSGVRQLRELGRLRGEMAAGAMPIVFTTMPDRVSTEADALEDAFRVFGRLEQSLTSTPQVWLDAQYFELDGGLMFNWDAVEARFPQGMIADMFQAFADLVHRLADGETAWTLADPVRLPPAQAARRAAANGATAPIPHRCVPAMIADALAAAPGRPVIFGSGAPLTAGALSARARAIADALAAAGVEAGDRVALSVARGPDQATAVLGIQAAGAAYLPLDRGSPAARLATILADARPRAVLVDAGAEAARQAAGGLPLIALEDIGPGAAPLDPASMPGPDAAAYVIYTSGSTGTPKGVVVGHRALANMVAVTNQRFGIGPDDRALAVTALHHDLSVYDLFGPLAAGGGIVCLDEDGALDPGHWLRRIRDAGATIWNSVPRLAGMLAAEAEAAGASLPVRRFVLGGDWVPVGLPARLKALAPGAVVTTIGGPTETTVWNIMDDVPDGPVTGPSLPYGRPIANCSYHILDDVLAERPDLVPGEMYCGGVCLADGYLGDPARTAERFITHPATGLRLYRTGDRGRWLPDGRIEFLGRVDFQLNIGGTRADPAEIEAAIAAHPGVAEAAVAARRLRPDDPAEILVAWIRPVPGSDIPDAAGLDAFLRGRLPRALTPRLWEVAAHWPLTANGKLDRKALTGGPLTATAATAGRAPETPLEQLIAGLWAETLGTPVTDAGANLFTLGADSLAATRVALRLEARIGVKPSLAAVFADPTIAGIADAVLTDLARRVAEGTAS